MGEKEYLEWDDLLPGMQVVTIRNKMESGL